MAIVTTSNSLQLYYHSATAHKYSPDVFTIEMECKTCKIFKTTGFIGNFQGNLWLDLPHYHIFFGIKRFVIAGIQQLLKPINKNK